MLYAISITTVAPGRSNSLVRQSIEWLEATSRTRALLDARYAHPYAIDLKCIGEIDPLDPTWKETA